MAEQGPKKQDPGKTGEDEKVARSPISAPITVERSFRVEGKQVSVQAVIPAAAAKEAGMETAMALAQRILLRLESKQAKIEEVGRSK